MQYDIIIIGAGPAGYVAAIRAGQVGLKTAIIEKENIGGMCLNWGCIPSKAMIESAKLFTRIGNDAAKLGIEGIDKKNITFNYSKAIKRASTIVTRLTKGVEFLLKKNGVEIIKGNAQIISPNTVSVENQTLEGKNIIIATGSRSPKIAENLENTVADAKQLFIDREIPENIVVVGNDSVAVELAQMFAMVGKKVTVAVTGDKLMPLADDYLSSYLLKLFQKEKIKVIHQVDISSIGENYTNGILKLNDTDIPCDLIVNATSREGIIPHFSIEIEIENGFIKTDKNCQSSIPGIFAVGDVNGKSHFAHAGSAQGLFVIDFIKGIKREMDLKKYPLNMYSYPEMAQIGSTESELKEKGTDYKISEFPLSANGKAMTEGMTEGFVRILSENKYGEVLGVQIVAANATDMIAEAAAYMQLESTVYDIAQTIHAHPTVSEIFMEAGFDGIGAAIHK